MDHLRLEKLRRAIRNHLTEHGGRNWKLVKDQFSDVPHASFWRAVKDVRGGGASGSEFNKEAPRIQEPNVGTLLFPADCQPLQKLAEYQALIRNAQDLIDHAKGRGGRIKNWQMHAKGVALRESLVRNQVQVMADLANQDVIDCFLLSVLDVVDEAAPAVLPRVLARFRELHEMTPEQLRVFTAEMKTKNEKRERP